MKKQFSPDPKIVQKYADLLVNFALNSGKGIKKGDVVEVIVPDVAKDMLKALQISILKAGGHPLLRLIPTGIDKDFYELASKEQLTFFPEKYLKAKADLIDHYIGIVAEPNPYELKDVDPEKIMLAKKSKKKYRDWLVDKENAGKFTWTIGMWPTYAKAEQVGLTIDEYWDKIVKACYLDKKDPIKEWQQISEKQKKIINWLNNLNIIEVHVEGKDMDLYVGIGKERKWCGGSGRNIPSYEIFTSPHKDKINGWIRFNEPLYRYGNVIEDIYMEVKDGKIIKAKAKKGDKLLQSMLKIKGADRFGEFSLTDASMSRIDHPMAETLFDENMGGKYGNMHLAIGMAYKDCYKGDVANTSNKKFEQMGYNDSAEHTDIVSTTDKKVTAKLEDGSEVVIYEHGHFKLNEI